MSRVTYRSALRASSAKALVCSRSRDAIGQTDIDHPRQAGGARVGPSRSGTWLVAWRSGIGVGVDGGVCVGAGVMMLPQ